MQDGSFAPETPRNEAVAGPAGFTFQVAPKLAVDFSATALHFKQVNNSYNHYKEDGEHLSFGGDYRSSAYSLGLGLSYKF